MFTGIIEELAEVKNIRESKNFYEVDILSKFANNIKVGDSLAINGVCLTATDISNNYFTVQIVKESLNKSSLRNLTNKTYVNLERSMKVSSRIDGHIVQGHIEAIGKVIDKKLIDNQIDLYIEVDKNLLKYCIKKGSIAIDGISLTIADIIDNQIKVAIIPYTLENTIIKYRTIGDTVNIETDIFAKYIENIISNKN